MSPRPVDGWPVAMSPLPDRPAAAPVSPRQEATDRLLPFRPLVTLIRCSTVLVGVVLTASDPRRTTAETVFATVLVTYSLIRIITPTGWRHRGTGAIDVSAETALCLAAVVSTGAWSSPFVFTLVNGVVGSGFASGFGLALGLAAMISAAVSASSPPSDRDAVRLATEGTAELVLAALVAGYGRRLFGEAERRTTAALSRVSALAETNELLQQLNTLALNLPASLDLRETVLGAIEQVRSLLHPDATAVLLWDASLTAWTVVGAEGAPLPAMMDDAALPAPLRKAARSAAPGSRALLVDLLADGPGLFPGSRAGMYTPLVARRSLVGVIAVESRALDGLSDRDIDLMTGVGEQTALAIDNAVSFARLRTIGAEEERTRIARDLHDRVAQSLAYLAFELDRIVDLSGTRSVTSELGSLRHDVRRVVTELRDTLHDLRTDVSDSQDMASTMGVFLGRVQARSGLEVSFDQQGTRRLALPIERELWRIAQEAVTNVERHARATHLQVEWATDAVGARLAVIDDGRGFWPGTAGRMDSYGLLGMRERADAIGATLDIGPAQGGGTAVRCRVEVS